MCRCGNHRRTDEGFGIHADIWIVFHRIHTLEYILLAFLHLGKCNLRFLPPHLCQRIIACRILKLTTCSRSTFLQRTHNLKTVHTTHGLTYQHFLRLFCIRIRLLIGLERRRLLLPIELQMHLITHGKTRNASILIRKCSLLDAVDLMQPLRHDLRQLIARNACGIPPAQIEIPFFFQMVHRIIHP